MNKEKKFEEFIEANRKNWDARTKAHIKSDYYNLQEFVENPQSLSFVADEHKDLGEIKGKKILHLQCHFGLDTLSLCRLGAEATGVDISGEAITFARQVNEQVGLEAEFIESDVYDLKKHLNEKYDIVFTSVGILCWLPDLEKWAEMIEYYLKPGGLFYINDGHPVKNIVEIDEEDEQNLVLKYPYFSEGKTYEWDEEGTYADPEAELEHTKNYQWDHTLGEIINSLAQARLKIEEFKEYPYLADKRYPCMEKVEKNRWVLAGKMKNMLPLSFSIKARKER